MDKILRQIMITQCTLNVRL